MAQTLSMLFNAGLLLMMFIGMALWVRLLWKHHGLTGRNLLESIVPAWPRRRPFWSPAEAILMLGATILITRLLMIVMVRYGWIEPSGTGETEGELSANGLMLSIGATCVGGITAVLLTLGWLRLFDPDPRRRVGFTLSMREITLGLRGTLMILPPVMIISAVTAYFVPYDHPVLQSLGRIATPPVFLVTFIGTALVTPVVEEFLVRGLLQGSLQGIADRNCDDVEHWYPRSFWPVLVSSIIFACMHIGGQGAAPIPLFVLSLGLGYLYRQTGSLTPSIVVHMLLNGLTLVVEILKLTSPV